MTTLSTATLETLGKLVGRALEARQRGDGRPFVVGHFVTQRCMCDCASCLWKDDAAVDVPLADLKHFYGQARDAGFLAAAFTGGEPFLRTDLGELARFVKQDAGMAILLFTTGLYLERRMDEVLPHIDMLLVSVDSARAERHDAIRGVPGLFDRLVKGVRLAKQRYPNLPIHLNCCVQKGMPEEVDALIALANDLGVRISFDVITEMRNGGDQPFTATDMGLPLAEVAKVCADLLGRKRAGAPIVNSERYFEYFANGRPGYRCHLPKLVMFIDGRGNAEHCLDLRHPLGNIQRDALGDIMASPRFIELRRSAERCSSCNSPTMVDLSQVWERPELALEPGGIAVT